MIASALDELADSGFSGFTFERIASRAGVHRATVYRRWPSKDGLIAEALLAQAGQVLPTPDTGSLRDDLRQLNHAVVAFITTPRGEGLLRALVSDAARQPEIVTAGRRYWSERFSVVGDVIRCGIDRGELPGETDPDFLLEMIISPLYLRLLVTLQPLTTDYVDRVIDWAIAAARTNGERSQARRPIAKTRRR